MVQKPGLSVLHPVFEPNASGISIHTLDTLLWLLLAEARWRMLHVLAAMRCHSCVATSGH